MSISTIFASELYEVFDFLYELRKLNRNPDLYGLGDSMFEDCLRVGLDSLKVHSETHLGQF